MNRKTKRIVGIVGLLLAAVFLSSLVGFMSDGFTKVNPSDWEIHSVNEDNFFVAEKYIIKSANTGLGYQITVTDQGQIKITGKNDADTAQKLEVQKITLPAGTYTFTSGARNTSINGYNMTIEFDDTTYHADFGANKTFTLESETVVTAYINIAAEAECNSTFSPVIVTGDKAGEFFTVG